MNNKDLKAAIVKDALSLAIAINANERFVLFWDKYGNCRAISSNQENFHFSVPSLKNLHTHHSKPVN